MSSNTSTKGVWRKRNLAEAFARTGRRPITARWVDVNKGDEFNPRYRSRLVAGQLKSTDRSEHGSSPRHLCWKPSGQSFRSPPQG